MEYETVIGLEVHVQLATNSKVFCGCSTKFGQPPNTQVCPVCLGLPGTLPVLNKNALDLAIKTALALNCEIQPFIKFDRKNYFYPDLPKNFQISQYDLPLSYGGWLEIAVNGTPKRIGIKRVHLEEDAGKLVHLPDKGGSLVDFNRTGIPLLEIVSEPDMNSPQEAYSYLMDLKATLEYLEVSDCNMEEGSLRCDANISLCMKGSKVLGTKTEVKNMNSFKGVREALTFEVNRQQSILEKKENIVQETRLWDPDQGATRAMRTKEEAHDYRYFPEPDLVPFTVEKTQIESIRKTLPELPQQRRRRFIQDYKIPEYDSEVLTREKPLADYFEECTKLYNSPKVISNWIMGEVFAQMSATNLTIDGLKLKPSNLVEVVKLIDEGVISTKIAKEVLGEMIEKGIPARQIVDSKGLTQVSDEAELEVIVGKIIHENPDAIKDYSEGKEKAFGFLVGQVMKNTQGKANPQVVNRLLKEKLDKRCPSDG